MLEAYVAEGSAAHNELLRSIASTIADYRLGEIARPDARHVETWVNQFPTEVRQGILREMAHVLKKTYLPRVRVEKFLTELASEPKLATKKPASFWRTVTLLDIQGGGASQREMLAIFDGILETEFGYGIADCHGPTTFLYLDDGVFTGNRVLKDIRRWLEEEAPEKSTLHVVTIALHHGGRWYASENITKAAKAFGKEIDITWWSELALENRKRYIKTSDVLQPSRLPDDDLVNDYVASLAYPPAIRPAGHRGANDLFTSEAGRDLLEQEFLKAGARIRSICPNLNEYQRPLGNMLLDTLGFGSLFATYRNCPNNCPLALWVGDPWHPLFPRKIN
jgi:hypothetical protein